MVTRLCVQCCYSNGSVFIVRSGMICGISKHPEHNMHACLAAGTSPLRINLAAENAGPHFLRIVPEPSAGCNNTQGQSFDFELE